MLLRTGIQIWGKKSRFPQKRNYAAISDELRCPNL